MHIRCSLLFRFAEIDMTGFRGRLLLHTDAYDTTNITALRWSLSSFKIDPLLFDVTVWCLLWWVVLCLVSQIICKFDYFLKIIFEVNWIVLTRVFVCTLFNIAIRFTTPTLMLHFLLRFYYPHAWSVFGFWGYQIVYVYDFNFYCKADMAVLCNLKLSTCVADSKLGFLVFILGIQIG